MTRKRVFTTVVVVLVIPCSATGSVAVPASSVEGGEPRYTYRRQHDHNGTGKFYMGREIAQVMGHRDAAWLERPQRDQEEQPTRLIAALDLQQGDVVADIGAGTGHVTMLLAGAVGPSGRVKAVDIQPQMLALLRRKLAAAKIRNVDLILGKEADPKLPEKSVDLVLLVDVYHEFAYPFEMMRSIIPSLKSDGRVVLVEYRKEDPAIPIKLVHKMTVTEVINEMEAVGLRHKGTVETLPRQHILIFERRLPESRPATQGSESP